MSEQPEWQWDRRALDQLEEYLERVRSCCREAGLAAEEVAADLRAHIMAEAADLREASVQSAGLQAILDRLGSPEQIAGIERHGLPERTLGLVDALLRDRQPVYQALFSPGALRRLCQQLTLIFVLTTAAYGAAMGAFRCAHPGFFFSDYELSAGGIQTLRGRVAGLDPATRTVYLREAELPAQAGRASIRFNVTDPSDPCEVASLGVEKGYGKVVLSPDTPLAEADAWRLPVYSALKAPGLFLITLLLCLPALYVLNLAFGLGLRLGRTLTLTLLGLAATGIMLAVFVPIVGLFSVVTASYHFAKLMHVLIFAIAGSFGIKVLYEGLLRVAGTRNVRVRSLLAAWLILYAVVGGQIAWTLKPWIGTPYLPATPPFRIESGNIYVSAFRSLDTMMGR